MELPPFRNVYHRFERRLPLQAREGCSPAISGRLSTDKPTITAAAANTASAVCAPNRMPYAQEKDNASRSSQTGWNRVHPPLFLSMGRLITSAKRAQPARHPQRPTPIHPRANDRVEQANQQPFHARKQHCSPPAAPPRAATKTPPRCPLTRHRCRLSPKPGCRSC